MPCLLIDDGAMVKTRRFGKQTYLGDPLNVINLFNRFEVDEIVLLDIRASVNRSSPDYKTIEMVADECWVPLTYGGGVRSLSDIETIILSGVEKIIIGTAATDISFISKAAKAFGTQCIIGSIDARRKMFGGYTVRVKSGKQKIPGTPVERALALQEAGAGEILLQAIDQDGEMNGYDLDLVAEVSSAVDIPIVACAGASKRADLPLPINAGASAAAAGSLFVFSGPERGVLINFPERDELERMLKTNFASSSQ